MVSRFLMAASLSWASASPPRPATARVTTAARAACRVDNFMPSPSLANFGPCRWLPQNNVRLCQSNNAELSSPLRDRYFDVGLEAGALAHPFIPRFEIS